MPRIVGALVSARLATLAELQTCYGVADAYRLLEIVSVDATNQRRLHERT